MSCDRCGESRYWNEKDGCLVCNRKKSPFRKKLDAKDVEGLLAPLKARLQDTLARCNRGKTKTASIGNATVEACLLLIEKCEQAPKDPVQTYGTCMNPRCDTVLTSPENYCDECSDYLARCIVCRQDFVQQWSEDTCSQCDDRAKSEKEEGGE